MREMTSLPGAHLQTLDLARIRLIMVTIILMMGYLGISARLVDLTLLQKPRVAEKGDIKPLAQPLRAAILDRNGEILATSLKMASVYADTTMVESPEELAQQLVKILPDLDHDDLVKKLSSGKEFTWIKRDVTPKQEYAINALGNPALSFQEEDRRIYPDGNLAAQVIGYTDLDGKGIAGIERSFDKQLTDGGKPVQLTLDLRVQHIMHEALSAAVKKFHAKAGIGMVMDVNTGEVISMVSLPDFDPNHVGDAKDAEKFNRATLGVFEMGSTFKLFSTAAALDSGLVHFSDMFDATNPIQMGRFKISDFHAKRRPLTVPEIFIYSSNIGTSKMAEKLGNDRMENFYRSMGFMTQAPIELPERGSPLYPSPWRDISTLTTSFGHGIAVSPLHLMRAASALVNGGIMPRSTLILPEHRDALSPEPQGERVISEKTSDKLRELLELTVVDGTGANAYVEGYNVGGKTGTAEKNAHGDYEHSLLLSSFLGVFPIEKPRYAVLAMLDEPQPTKETHNSATGGWTAAPVVGSVIQQMGPLYQIAPDFARTHHNIEKVMGIYLKEFKEGNRLASAGIDH